MKGRLEHSLQTENTIEKILDELPSVVTDYYYEFKSGRQPKSCLEYIRKINKFLCFINQDDLKNIDISNITRLDVSKFLDSISYTIDNNGSKKESSLSYRQGYHSILKSFFDYLYDNQYINENPLQRIKRPKGEDYVHRIFLNEYELKDVLLAVETGAGNDRCVSRQYKWQNRDRVIMMLFIQTGIRETALSEINVEDIDFGTHTIKSVIEKGHKDKIFKMSSKLEGAMIEWIDTREKLLNGKEEDALFISSERKRISQRSLYEIVGKFTKEALGYSVSPHKLRAAFANLMLEKTNGNIYVVQQLLGHSRTDTTAKIYVKDNRNKYNDLAANIIEETIFD
jgi:tyrosine recombinase xerC